MNPRLKAKKPRPPRKPAPDSVKTPRRKPSAVEAQAENLLADKKKWTIQDLAKIRDQAQAMINIRDSRGRVKITVHMGTCGLAAGARDIMTALLDEIRKRKLTDVIVSTSGCAGFCNREPMATVEVKGQPPVKYADLTPEKMRAIVAKHVQGGRLVSDFALAIGSETVY